MKQNILIPPLAAAHSICPHHTQLVMVLLFRVWITILKPFGLSRRCQSESCRAGTYGTKARWWTEVEKSGRRNFLIHHFQIFPQCCLLLFTPLFVFILCHWMCPEWSLPEVGAQSVNVLQTFYCTRRLLSPRRPVQRLSSTFVHL